MICLTPQPVYTNELSHDQELPNRSSTKSFRWIEALSHVAPQFGGISTCVAQLGARLATHPAFDIALASFTETDETKALKSISPISVTHWPASRVAWWLNRKLRSDWRSLVEKTDGLHLHGLWETHTTIAAHTARALGKPYILSAHGMLDPWALKNKTWKKRLYSLLIERKNVKGAACLHALTLAEANDYRKFGSRKPIAVIPNGIDVPLSPGSSLFLTRYSYLRSRRIVLFLGRLHFKKGLDILLRAWAGLYKSFPDAVLVLAGPDSADSREEIECLADSLALGESVLFTGMLTLEAKWSALASAHAFVLPSYSEGLSMAVLEAMGMGVPVIVSHECHIPEVEAFDAGWQISPTVGDLTTALRAMLSNSSVRNAEIGNRGRRLVQNQFSASTVTEQMADLYRWVQGGPRPTTFQLLEVDA